MRTDRHKKGQNNILTDVSMARKTDRQKNRQID